ncbi:MAG: thiol-disulfide oxidoreductase DCC family protein [Bacteroidota bacterium]
MNKGQDIILFDGYCNLCNGAVRFIIRFDGKGRYKLAALSSDAGKAALNSYGLSMATMPDSIVLLHEGRILQKSAAALQIAAGLGGFWKLAKVFYIVPRFIRDAVYDWVARNRYRIFGKKEVCMLPGPETAGRFL